MPTTRTSIAGSRRCSRSPAEVSPISPICRTPLSPISQKLIRHLLPTPAVPSTPLPPYRASLPALPTPTPTTLHPPLQPPIHPSYTPPTPPPKPPPPPPPPPQASSTWTTRGARTTQTCSRSIRAASFPRGQRRKIWGSMEGRRPIWRGRPSSGGNDEKRARGGGGLRRAQWEYITTSSKSVNVVARL